MLLPTAIRMHMWRVVVDLLYFGFSSQKRFVHVQVLHCTCTSPPLYAYRFSTVHVRPAGRSQITLACHDLRRINADAIVPVKQVLAVDSTKSGKRPVSIPTEQSNISINQCCWLLIQWKKNWYIVSNNHIKKILIYQLSTIGYAYAPVHSHHSTYTHGY